MAGSADPAGPLSGLMRSLRQDLADVDESVALAARHRYQRCGGQHAADAVDGERFLYATMSEVLRVLTETVVEPGGRLTLAFVAAAAGAAEPVRVPVTEIAVRIEREHLQRLTREKEPRVYLDTVAVREAYCPAELRARLADLSDPRTPGRGGGLALLLIDDRGPTIADVW